MTKEELEKLLELLNKFEKAVYPTDTGSSEESDLHSVQYDVKFCIEYGITQND